MVSFSRPGGAAAGPLFSLSLSSLTSYASCSAVVGAGVVGPGVVGPGVVVFGDCTRPHDLDPVAHIGPSGNTGTDPSPSQRTTNTRDPDAIILVPD